MIERILPVGLLLVYLCMNVLSNICFKQSANSQNVRRFTAWQIGGNLAGFCAVLLFTAVLRYLPISVAFPVSQGLAVISVQLIAAWFFFKERISLAQWLGTGLIVIGIIFISIPNR